MFIHIGFFQKIMARKKRILFECFDYFVVNKMVFFIHHNNLKCKMKTNLEMFLLINLIINTRNVYGKLYLSYLK